MSLMPQALKKQVGNDWLPTLATVTTCDQTGSEVSEGAPAGSSQRRVGVQLEHDAIPLPSLPDQEATSTS